MKQQTKALDSQLPSGRAFVIQFSASSNILRRRIAGRVEHIVSGHSTHFQSLKELLAFIAQVVHETQGKEGDKK